MMKNLTKHGNSRALIIDRTMMELLKIDDSTTLELRIEGEQLVVTPVRQLTREQRLSRSLEKTNAKYGRTLKKLSE